MRTRVLQITGVAAITAAVVVSLTLVAHPRADAGSTARTPWGEPDLQGLWTSGSTTPLQRPSRYANREFFTDQERAELDRVRSGIVGEDRRAERGSEQDVAGAYSAAIFAPPKRVGRRTSLVVDPQDGRLPPFTDAVKKRNAEMTAYRLALLQATSVCKDNLVGCRGGTYGPPSPRRLDPPPHYLATRYPGGGSINRADGPEDRSPDERCLSAILPDLGATYQIVQSPGTVSIFYDTGQGQGWPRVIPITTRPHLPSSVRQWWGDSRGRWEGDVLVVDVTNFSPKTDYQGSRENLHLIERWHRGDANTIEYTVTLEDPTAWTRPWTMKQEFQRQNDKANKVYKEPRCHEGNNGLVAMLSGARADERAFAAHEGPAPATVCNGGGCGGFAVGFADEGEDADPLNR